MLAVEEPLPGCDVGGNVEVRMLGFVGRHLVFLLGLFGGLVFGDTTQSWI